MANDDQSKSDRRQDATLQALQGKIAKMQAELAKPELVEGTNQRMRLQVKNPAATTVVLGQEKDSQNYTGFSVQTMGHVFIQTHGSADTSRLYLQAAGPLVAQSDSNALMLAKGSTMVGATNNVLVAGDQGVNIVAGAGPTPDVKDPDGGNPPEPQMPLVSEYNSAWTWIGAAVTSAMAMWQPIDGYVGKQKYRFKIGDILAASNLAYGVGSSVFNEVTSYAGSNTSLGETVNIDASRNVNLNALQNASVAAGIGAGMVAPSVNLVGFAQAGMFGGASVGIGSGRALELKAHKNAELASGKETVVSTGAKGSAASLTLRGEAKDATLKATRGVDLDAGDGKSLVEMTNDGGFSVTSEKSACITVADKYEIKISKDGIEICKKGDEPAIKINDNDVTILAKGKVFMRGGSGGKGSYFAVHDEGIDVAKWVKVGSSFKVAKSGKVDIG